MRVIAGEARGCGLVSPKGTATRPTTDRLKENLFNILSPRISGARFLDLYSGSGAIGIEAMSRGAREAVLVESAPAAIGAIKANLEKTRLGQRATLLSMSAERALKELSQKNGVFDIIFMDPPYAKSIVSATLSLLEQYPVLSENGIIVAELSAQEAVPESAFKVRHSKTYGNTQFVFFENGDV